MLDLLNKSARLSLHIFPYIGRLRLCDFFPNVPMEIILEKMNDQYIEWLECHVVDCVLDFFFLGQLF